MPEVRRSSGFKYVFWGILFLFILAFAGQLIWITLGGLRPIPHLFGLRPHGPWVLGPSTTWPILVTHALPTLLLLFIWVGVVGRLVYRDAQKRGMDPYLWAAVAVFVPFFIGIIVYLVVRSNGRAICDSCGEPIRSEYKVCPYCGQRRELLCPECSKAIAPEWKVCPYCEHKLVPAP
ncbi:MAG: zinc ribbon domain-containing protein [Candidatus Latescibacterota bacterium]|nr:MAG: zinc ribbon domain-containing protein [Candidatus Latescibacterota bacterium]